MYRSREMSLKERAELLVGRQRAGRPWHGPPHWCQDMPLWFHLTAACHEHAPYIGQSACRMDGFASDLITLCGVQSVHVAAWCLLANHYHLLIRAPDLRAFTTALGRLHGQCSYQWNSGENKRGRQVFYRDADRHIRSQGHFWATFNYVHHNPVHHGYVTRWTDSPWSSAIDYLRDIGQSAAADIWRRYPLFAYGKDWDAPDA